MGLLPAMELLFAFAVGRCSLLGHARFDDGLIRTPIHPHMTSMAAGKGHSSPQQMHTLVDRLPVCLRGCLRYCINQSRPSYRGSEEGRTRRDDDDSSSKRVIEVSIPFRDLLESDSCPPAMSKIAPVRLIGIL